MEFLDYGGSELVPLSALKCLPEQCKRLPFQAIKASLYGKIWFFNTKSVAATRALAVITFVKNWLFSIGNNVCAEVLFSYIVSKQVLGEMLV